MHVRVCVECDEEYRPEVARCADCGGALQDRYDDEGSAEGREATPSPVRPEEPLALAHAIATSASARDLVPLADGLLKAGIEFRIVAREVAGEDRPPGYELQVRDAERGEALQTVAPLVESDSAVTLLVLRTPPPAAEEDAETELRCPGCDSPVEASATECPECGLGLQG